MYIQRNKYLIAISLFLLLNSFNVSRTYKDKLLVTATINDSISIDRKGINWLSNPVCVDLKIDTVNEGVISQFKRDDRFYYYGNVYNNSQLLNLKDLQKAKDIKISKIIMQCANAKFYVDYTISKGSCFSDSLKETLVNYHNTAIRMKKTLNLYFDVYINSSNNKESFFCRFKINLIPQINNN